MSAFELFERNREASQKPGYSIYIKKVFSDFILSDEEVKEARRVKLKQEQKDG